jgi:integrase
VGKLTATGLKGLKQPGSYVDGDGLMLIVTSSHARSWIVRVKEPGKAGKRRDFGLGSASDVSLSAARDRAASIRGQVKDGKEPVMWWRKEAEPMPTFKVAAKKLHKEMERTWKNGKHQAQWLSTLETHVFPALGEKPVDMIDPPAIRDVLMRIWLDIPETARRVKQRIGAVLDWAHANGYRPAEAPMRSVTKGLPRQPKNDGHFDAMPFAKVPDFIKLLREKTSVSRWALELLILTATRSGEVRGAKWREFDLEADDPVWTIPADRMKAGKAHIVPLSPAAVAVLKSAQEHSTGDLVFPGRVRDKPMSDMTMTKLLRDMDIGVTVHGFRSAFRDWCAEETNFPAEVAEAALAHAIPDKVVAAYKRTDFLAKRRLLMAAWASFLIGQESNGVIKLSRARRRTA